MISQIFSNRRWNRERIWQKISRPDQNNGYLYFMEYVVEERDFSVPAAEKTLE